MKVGVKGSLWAAQSVASSERTMVGSSVGMRVAWMAAWKAAQWVVCLVVKLVGSRDVTSVVH